MENSRTIINASTPYVLASIMSETPCLRVPKTLGERARMLLLNLNLLNQDLKIQQAGDNLYIPLANRPLPTDVKKLKEKLPKLDLSTHKFPQRAKHPQNLTEALEDKLPPHLLASVPSAIDFVGEIAIIEVPPELEQHEEMIGEAIMDVHKHVHTVLAKSGAVEGTYRLRDFEVLAGSGETETIHKEYGCAYHVDITKAYFSPRLSHEHDRVASQVNQGETIVDMFAGVGPFSVLIAKRHENVRVYAIDLNPEAVDLLERNLKENSVERKVTPILGDAKEVITKELDGIADRVIMNLPERAIEYVDAACKAVKPEGGIIHYYDFAETPNPLETAKVRLIEAVKKSGRGIRKVLLTRKVRAIAPYAWQVVVDVETR